MDFQALYEESENTGLTSMTPPIEFSAIKRSQPWIDYRAAIQEKVLVKSKDH